VADFAADVRELADTLSLDRFSVVGVSAGGPYALALAHELPDRVSRIAVCSSMAPMCPPHRSADVERRIRLALRLVAEAPDLCAAFGDIVLPVLRRQPRLITRVIAAHASRGEQARLRTPQEQSAAVSSFLAATAHGVRGMIDDYGVACRDWGFSPSEIETEVQLWHGVRDPLVPIEHALQLAISLPRCRVFFDPDEGHHFFRARLKTILATLADQPTDRPATAYRPRPV
jgi:pimeloyl-ACP methyl ester carboxylesterase